MNHRCISNIFLIALSIVAAVALYFAFFEPPFLSYPRLPLAPTKRFVKPGEIVPLQVLRCSSSATPRTYTIARSMQLISTGRHYVMPDILIEIKPGCHDATSLAHHVPLGIPDGEYKILGLSEVPGAWRTNYVGWESGPFIVYGGVGEQ